MEYTIAFIDEIEHKSLEHQPNDVILNFYRINTLPLMNKLQQFTFIYVKNKYSEKLIFKNLPNVIFINDINDLKSILEKGLYRYNISFNKENELIPKIIHQMWLSPNNNDPPVKYSIAQKTWKNWHPSWQIKIWNTEKIDHLVLKYFPQYYEEFKNLPKIISRCDIARMMVVYLEGGLYSDLDFYCMKPFDEFLNNKELVLFQEIPEHQIHGKKLFNGIFAAKKHHPFLKDYIDQMFINIKKTPDSLLSFYVMNTTGPTAFQAFLKKYPEILPFDGTLVMPYTNKKILSKAYKKEGYLAYTLWDEGTGWANPDISSSVFYGLLLFSVVFIVFLILYLLSGSRKNRELKKEELVQ